MNNENIFKYILSIVLTVCGFLIVQSYNRLNNNIATLNADMLDIRVGLVDIQNKMLSECKVKEIIEAELLKKGLIK